MRKLVVGSIAAAAMVFAVAPGTAFACTGPASAAGVCAWNGFSGSHTDNLADEPAYALAFGNNGLGDSQYCLEANGSLHCDGGGVTSPIYFAGYVFLPVVGCEGCSHGAPPSDSTLGGVYVGTTPGGGSLGDIGIYH